MHRNGNFSVKISSCHLARKIHTASMAASTGFTKVKELNQVGSFYSQMNLFSVFWCDYLGLTIEWLVLLEAGLCPCPPLFIRKVFFSEGTYEHGQQWYIRGHEKDGDSAGISSSESNEMAPEPMSVNVSDPDFQNFDIGLNRKFLWNDEVWAASDGKMMGCRRIMLEFTYLSLCSHLRCI